MEDELPAERLLQDRLPQRLAPAQRRVDLALVPLDHLELLVEQADDFALLGEGANDKRQNTKLRFIEDGERGG